MIILLVDGIVFVVLLGDELELIFVWLRLEFFVELDVFELGVGGVGVLLRLFSEFFLFDLICIREILFNIL